MISHRGKRTRGHALDMAGVAGSTPVEPTKFPKLKPGQVVEVPSEYAVVTFLEWDGLKPRAHWLLRGKSPKSCKNPVNGKRRSRSA